MITPTAISSKGHQIICVYSRQYHKNDESTKRLVKLSITYYLKHMYEISKINLGIVKRRMQITLATTIPVNFYLMKRPHLVAPI